MKMLASSKRKSIIIAKRAQNISASHPQILSNEEEEKHILVVELEVKDDYEVKDENEDEDEDVDEDEDEDEIVSVQRGALPLL